MAREREVCTELCPLEDPLSQRGGSSEDACGSAEIPPQSPHELRAVSRALWASVSIACLLVGEDVVLAVGGLQKH